MSSETSAVQPTAVRANYLKEWLTRLGPFLGLALVIFTFAVISGAPERFLSPFNLRIVLSQTVIVALGAIGMTVIIISAGIDLSVGSTIALAGVVTAIGLNAGYSPTFSVIGGILTGALIGVVNGLAITRLKVVPFIATLGMLGIARGVAKWLAGQQTVNVPATWVNDLAVTFPTPSWLLLAPGIWLTMLLAVVMAVVLRNTVFGRRVFALGSNEAAARACGDSNQQTESANLRPRRPLLRARGCDADVSFAPGRPDRCRGNRARCDRFRSHRRRKFERRRGKHSRLYDWGAHHGFPAQRMSADGLA
ncbi:MAG: ABC transporter permease [Pyrinomonadaceae bacterium]